MRKAKMIQSAIGIIALVFLILVCAHSVEEIHYLKSFFPRQFTVTEASFAAGVELIKILIIGLPVVFGYFVIRDILNDSK